MKVYLRICDGFQGILLKGATNGVDYTFQYTLDGAFKHASFDHTLSDGRTALLSVDRGHFIYYPYWKEGDSLHYPQECWGNPESAINHFMPNLKDMWSELLASANAEIKCKLEDVLEVWANCTAIDLMKEI